MAYTEPTHEAKEFEVLGAGFGMLQFNGVPLELVADFRDQGQHSLGQAITVQTINSRRPICIIPPMAIDAGQFTFTTYGLKEDGLWGTVFNGQFKNSGSSGTAPDLVDVFTKQLQDGALKLQWVTTDVNGVPTKVYTYSGIVITDAQRNITVDNQGARQASWTFTCRYTRVLETTANSSNVVR